MNLGVLATNYNNVVVPDVADAGQCVFNAVIQPAQGMRRVLSCNVLTDVTLLAKEKSKRCSFLL
jgi:hypothetical protein